MKIVFHLIAATIGLLAAALIVFLVFGSASEQGATQDGDAPAGQTNAAQGLCGSVTPAEGRQAAAISTARENLPLIRSGVNQDVTPAPGPQADWFARIHAAAGLCVDEIQIADAEVTNMAISTNEKVSESRASKFVAQAIQQQFTRPLNRPTVNINALVGGEQRTVHITKKAYDSFQRQRKSLNLPNTMTGYVKFRKVAGFSTDDLRLTGWKG